MTKILLVFMLAILVVGCGPKMAKKETLDVLAEARAALEAAEARISELEAEKAALEAQYTALNDEIGKMEDEIGKLQNKIDTRCKKTGRKK
jgi:peptidoglycan hydrolase CwlO-like protein